jgi:hypothetical protein
LTTASQREPPSEAKLSDATAPPDRGGWSRRAKHPDHAADAQRHRVNNRRWLRSLLVMIGTIGFATTVTWFVPIIGVGMLPLAIYAAIRQYRFSEQLVRADGWRPTLAEQVEVVAEGVQTGFVSLLLLVPAGLAIIFLPFLLSLTLLSFSSADRVPVGIVIVSWVFYLLLVQAARRCLGPALEDFTHPMAPPKPRKPGSRPSRASARRADASASPSSSALTGAMSGDYAMASAGRNSVNPRETVSADQLSNPSTAPDPSEPPPTPVDSDPFDFDAIPTVSPEVTGAVDPATDDGEFGLGTADTGPESVASSSSAIIEPPAAAPENDPPQLAAAPSRDDAAEALRERINARRRWRTLLVMIGTIGVTIQLAWFLPIPGVAMVPIAVYAAIRLWQNGDHLARVRGWRPSTEEQLEVVTEGFLAGAFWLIPILLFAATIAVFAPRFGFARTFGTDPAHGLAWFVIGWALFVIMVQSSDTGGDPFLRGKRRSTGVDSPAEGRARDVPTGPSVRRINRLRTLLGWGLAVGVSAPAVALFAVTPFGVLILPVLALALWLFHRVHVEALALRGLRPSPTEQYCEMGRSLLRATATFATRSEPSIAIALALVPLAVARFALREDLLAAESWILCGAAIVALSTVCNSALRYLHASDFHWPLVPTGQGTSSRSGRGSSSAAGRSIRRRDDPGSAEISRPSPSPPVSASG